MEEGEASKKQSWFDRTCCCCPSLFCFGYACCCCYTETEGKPLLRRNSNGIDISSYTLPKGQELQEMDYHLSGANSVTDSSPWNSERQSEISEPPDVADVDSTERAPITEEPHPLEPRRSWKLYSGESGDDDSTHRESFTIQIRKQTTE